MTLIVYYDPDSLYIKLLHMILMVSDYEVNLKYEAKNSLANNKG